MFLLILSTGLVSQILQTQLRFLYIAIIIDFNLNSLLLVMKEEGLSLECANEGFFILCPFIPSYTEGGIFKVKSKRMEKGKNKKSNECVRSGGGIELNHCSLKQAEQRRPFPNLLSSIRLLAGCETENWKLKAT